MFRLIPAFILLFGFSFASLNVEAETPTDQPVELALDADGGNLSQYEVDRVLFLSACHWACDQNDLEGEYKVGTLTIEKDRDARGNDTYKVSRTLGGGNNSILIIGQL